MKQKSANEAKPRRSAAPVLVEPQITRGLGVQTVYETLKRDILDMTLAPGDQLDETRLSTRFSLSRTPVREALVRLTSEGLVTTLPNRNTIVAVIDFASVPMYLDALTLMYRVTTRLAAQRRAPAHIDEMQRWQDSFAKAVDDADAIAMITVNRHFHLAIARAGGNPYFTEFFERLLDQGQRLLRLYYSSYNDHLPQKYVAEHDAMIAAVADKDEERADRIGGEHAVQVVTQIQSFLASGIAREMKVAAAGS
jgi:DNA-binding GntR family transcriptional regulator